VKNVPAGWEGHLWAIAFTKSGIRAETRVNADGTFRLEHVPPGEYGVKVGHDGYLDAEVPRIGSKVTEADWNRQANAWKAARVVRVQPGHVSDGVELELPPGAELPKQANGNADAKE
jgi:Carboxypeptidase regulatory-like domain